MTKLVNRAKMTTATTGTGTITLGSAVDGYQTFANAGVANADVVRYVIEDGDAWEIGLGTYTASGTTLTRGSIESSNADNALNLTGNAVVYVSAAAADLQELVDFADNFVLPTADGSTGQVLTTNGAGTLTFSTISGYTNADVDAHLNTGTATTGEVLSWTGSDYDWIAAPAALLGDTDSASPFETSLGFEAGLNNTGASNTFVGYRAGKANTSGASNVAIGHQTLDENTTGASNVAIGAASLGSNTTGSQNVAIGDLALISNDSSNGSVAVGYAALQAATSANNVAIGRTAMYFTSTGATNVGIGNGVLYSLTTGSNNVALGNGALDAATTGGRNVAIGFDAMGIGVTTEANGDNVSVGYQAGARISSGNTHTFVGAGAGRFYTTASGATAVGGYALGTATGANNTALGVTAGFAVTTGANNTLLGYQAGRNGIVDLTTGSNNTIIGFDAASSSATVSNEITLGNSSITRFRVPGIQAAASNGDVLTYDATNGIMSLQAPAGGGATDINGLSDGYNTGSSLGLGTGSSASSVGIQSVRVGGFADADSDAVAIGYGAHAGDFSISLGTISGQNVTTGTGHVGLGHNALRGDPTAKLTGSYNIGLGYQTGYDLSTGANNFLGGYLAGTNLTTGSNNVAIGNGALDAATTANTNVAIGWNAMGSCTTGSTNIAIGVEAIGAGNLVGGLNNIALGYQSGENLTSGDSNICIGALAGDNISEGNFNIVIGQNAASTDTNDLTTGSNNIVLGFNSATSSATVSNEITLGNASITRFRVPGAGIDNTSAALSGTTPSVDVGARDTYTLTTSGNTTFTFTGVPSSGQVGTFSLIITAGGTHTLTWPASVDWAGGTAPAAPASGQTDIYTFMTVNGGTTFYGFLAGDAMA